ncbi:MAG: V-type ATP synthase subunit F [Candidatus Omnitrophica bacterium]|nr:V-type ATP synthase subunit F [Candidatus Omnitrophota bacterium]
MPEPALEQKPLVIIGKKDSVSGFSALGFKVYAVEESKEFKELLGEIVGSKPSICLVEEEVYLNSQEEIKAYKNLPLPIFLPFSSRGSSKALKDLVKDIRLRATGTI